MTPFSLTGEEAEQSAPAAQQESGTADRVYVVNGATITWDLERKEYSQPNEAQAAKLAQQFSEWMTAKLTKDGKTPATMADVEVETMPNGMKRARLPVSLMNTAMVRVNADGHFDDVCTKAHEAPALDSAQAPVTAEEEQR